VWVHTARERPDLIVSDRQMPGQDGYDLIRQVRALSADRGGAIPTIALTAADGREEQRRAIRARFYLLVPKPVTSSELVRAVAAVEVQHLAVAEHDRAGGLDDPKADRASWFGRRTAELIPGLVRGSHRPHDQDGRPQHVA